MNRHIRVPIQFYFISIPFANMVRIDIKSGKYNLKASGIVSECTSNGDREI